MLQEAINEKADKEQAEWATAQMQASMDASMKFYKEKCQKEEADEVKAAKVTASGGWA